MIENAQALRRILAAGNQAMEKLLRKLHGRRYMVLPFVPKIHINCGVVVFGLDFAVCGQIPARSVVGFSMVVGIGEVDCDDHELYLLIGRRLEAALAHGRLFLRKNRLKLTRRAT